MPRPPRIHVTGGIYHGTLRGNHRQAIFRRDGERRLLNLIVARALDKHAARLHAYCWMTNHLHFLVQVADRPLGLLMQRIASEYARAFQKSLATTGHLFENRYYATLVGTDTYLLEALRYVHQNPVRAGMVANAALYRWSSHHAYLGERAETWVTTELALAQFSGDRDRARVRYRAFIDETPAEEMAEELAALETGAPLLGKPEFVARFTPSGSRARSTLDDVLLEGCRHFGVTVAELRSPLRKARLVAARGWIAWTATRKSACSLAAVARELNRDESTLRSAMRKIALQQGAEGLAEMASEAPR